MRFFLSKMQHEQGKPGEPLRYRLADHELNQLLGRKIRIEHTGRIECVECSARLQKTFGDGYCWPCFSSLARCDMCIVRPHTCHYKKGTCREPEWGEAHCMTPHVVYLAVSSGLKVGVTRAETTLVRWGDQGAVAAGVLARTPDRLTAGQIEHSLTAHLSDRTSWQKLLTGKIAEVDLESELARVGGLMEEGHKKFLSPGEEIARIDYPVARFLDKAKSANLLKIPEVEGEFLGIKGQYLLIGQKGFNVRRHSGFQVVLEVV